jgi:hypothetical protein
MMAMIIFRLKDLEVEGVVLTLTRIIIPPNQTNRRITRLRVGDDLRKEVDQVMAVTIYPRKPNRAIQKNLTNEERRLVGDAL